MTGSKSLARFRDLLQKRLGWTFADNDLTQTATVLTTRAKAHGLSERDYLDRLDGRRWTAEIAELAQALSITETYFFRHEEQFRVLQERVLPDLIESRAGQRVLRIFSVGCSSGEEAYSLAIAAATAKPADDWIVTVVGVDANRQVLAKARSASYSPWSLRDTPEDVRTRWFRRTSDGYRVDERVAATVRFAEHNVAGEDPQLWRTAGYDLIFCRNLLMYLTDDVRANLYRKMTRALADGGYLFLGHTDSMGPRPDGMVVCHVGGTVYYQRQVTPAAPEPAPAPASPPAVRVARPPMAGPDLGADAYRRALGLLRDDRFAEALDALGDREVLLRGVLLAQLGRVDEARATAHRLIDVGGPQPDAHHLLGICHELDCADQATGQYKLAAYLDSQFAMPRLRMGLLARRRGDDTGAADHLEAALRLLAAESEERIMLFGGGFGRLALTTLCRTELDACGVRR
ncbi:CheR family methyltransferase [Actinoplanes derwentensis]|uniref:Chemotaxis protein methyltransferase CheR n=1 Tax=Actinoplanes derwentensis TaxID=113562 RepID=A0A1H1QJ62_9ACTN|nr:protein-glutamate O-methyltransferase CheR [Actinoplanes derwentensis]GID82133.1 protein-glutamate O-methyltransferase [Actinoplanes derwentensis]SDS22939.1 chemotaxis protein methyltransferase CheR [Actinoplanes derwentensis]